MMMKSVESVRLLVILADVLGSIIKGVVCRCLLLGLNISPFSLLYYVVISSTVSCLSLTHLSHLLRVQLHF